MKMKKNSSFFNNIINEKGLLLLEFRTIKDPLMKKVEKLAKQRGLPIIIEDLLSLNK